MENDTGSGSSPTIAVRLGCSKIEAVLDKDLSLDDLYAVSARRICSCRTESCSYRQKQKQGVQ